jgi:hypothetical protein
MLILPKDLEFDHGEAGRAVPKAVVKFGGRALMGRCGLGGDGSATNFVQSFVFSLSLENQEKIKDGINS